MQMNAMERLRRRAALRLDELDITARQVARELRRGDAWISAVLAGRQGIQLRDLDAFARALKLPPSELVRDDDTELRELSPSEMRLIRRFRDWPPSIQTHWLALMDHFASTEPDRDVSVLAALLSEKPPSERGVIVRWLERLMRADIPPGGAVPVAAGKTSEVIDGTVRTRLRHQGSRKRFPRR